MKFHNHTIANIYSFNDIITMKESNKTMLNEILKLRNRCLDPSNYYKHLKNWLAKFTRKQLISIDGDELRNQPFKTMLKLQHMMNVNFTLDYKLILKYDKKKRFFCMYNISKYDRKTHKCLGSSKGRSYPKLNDTFMLNYLNNYFNKSNILFYNLLKSYSFDVPRWLKKFIMKK